MSLTTTEPSSPEVNRNARRPAADGDASSGSELLTTSTGNTMQLLDACGDVISVDKIHGHDDLSTPTSVGGRLSASCTSLGKAFLAFSDREVISRGQTRLTPNSAREPGQLQAQLCQIRQQGIAVDREEDRRA